MYNNTRTELLTSILSLLKRDVQYYLLDIKSLAIFITVFLSGLLVFLVSLKNMLGNSNDYFLFLLTGYLVVSYMNISGGAGFEVINDSYEGKLMYDKTLPIRRGVYSVIRILGISLRGYVNFVICFLFMSPLLIHYFTIFNIVTFFVLSYILSVIFTGISILPLILTNNLTIQSVVGALLRSWFFLGSTIFYPFNIIPSNLQLIILLNPVTWVLELLRTLMHIPFASEFPIMYSAIVIGLYFFLSLFGSVVVLLNYNHEK